MPHGAGQNAYFISSLNFLSNWEFGKNLFLKFRANLHLFIYLLTYLLTYLLIWYQSLCPMHTPFPIPMCVGTVSQGLFLLYFPTKILLEHVILFLWAEAGQERKGRQSKTLREANINTFFCIQGML